MIIRRLTPTDANSYRRLMLEAYAAHPEVFTTNPAERAARPLSWWQARLSTETTGQTRVFGAFDAQGELRGAVGLMRKTQQKTQHKASLFGLFVCPSLRNQGIASELIEHLLAEAQSLEPLLLIQLSVTESNTAAVSLYQRYGFKPFGSEPLAIQLGGQFFSKLHMWRMLRP